MKLVTMCFVTALLTAVTATYANAANDIPNLTDIAKDSSGNVISMNTWDAVKYCSSRGYRLPAIRQLALWATQYGAKMSDTPIDGYEEIEGTGIGGGPDTFYYEHSGYVAPAGELNNIYWSFSISPRYAPHGTLPLILNSYGFIIGPAFDGYEDYKFNVRCVR